MRGSRSHCLRCVSGLFMLTCLLGILWMWSAPGSDCYDPNPLSSHTQHPPPHTTTTFCVNYEITQRTNERASEGETRWGKLHQLALPTQHISQSIARLLRDQRFFPQPYWGSYKNCTYTKKYICKIIYLLSCMKKVNLIRHASLLNRIEIYWKGNKSLKSIEIPLQLCRHLILCCIQTSFTFNYYIYVIILHYIKYTTCITFRFVLLPLYKVYDTCLVENNTTHTHTLTYTSIAFRSYLWY